MICHPLVGDKTCCNMSDLHLVFFQSPLFFYILLFTSCHPATGLFSWHFVAKRLSVTVSARKCHCDWIMNMSVITISDFRIYVDYIMNTPWHSPIYIYIYICVFKEITDTFPDLGQRKFSFFWSRLMWYGWSTLQKRPQAICFAQLVCISTEIIIIIKTFFMNNYSSCCIIIITDHFYIKLFSLHAKPHSCNLPPALLAAYLGSFTCYCANMGVERIPK